MLGPIEVHRVLLERQIDHEIVHLPRRLLDADDLPDVLGLPPTRCAAVRVLAIDGRAGRGPAAMIAVAVPAGTWPDPAALAAVLGVRSALPASSAEASAATDYSATLVSPVGLPPALALLLDTSLVGVDPDIVLYTAAGAPSVALGIRAADLLACTGARLAELLPVRAPGWDSGGLPGGPLAVPA